MTCRLHLGETEEKEVSEEENKVEVVSVLLKMWTDVNYTFIESITSRCLRTLWLRKYAGTCAGLRTHGCAHAGCWYCSSTTSITTSSRYSHDDIYLDVWCPRASLSCSWSSRYALPPTSHILLSTHYPSCSHALFWHSSWLTNYQHLTKTTRCCWSIQ